MSEDKTETNKDKKGSLEGILASTGMIGVLGLNSMGQYWLLEKAGVYAGIYADACANESALWDMYKYVGLNMPVAFCAATGAFVIGKYLGAWIDKKRNKN